MLWHFGSVATPEIPKSPLQPLQSRKTLYDFDDLRVKGGLYLAPNAGNTPYLYFDSSRYEDVQNRFATVDGTAGTAVIEGLNSDMLRPDPDESVGRFRVCENPFATDGYPFFEPDGFIILSAGLDGVFYTADDLFKCMEGKPGRIILDSQND